MPDSPRRRRDPEARRNAIVLAAAELIVEVGVDAVTHRMVAARADVPLGATTQYFDTLDDLREVALELLIEHVAGHIRGLRETLEAEGRTPAVIAAYLSEILADPPGVQADRAVVTAAVHDPRLRSIARALSRDLVAIFEPAYGADRATAVAVFIDGVLWHSQLADAPLARSVIETALAGILGDSPTT